MELAAKDLVDAGKDLVKDEELKEFNKMMDDAFKKKDTDEGNHSG